MYRSWRTTDKSDTRPGRATGRPGPLRGGQRPGPRLIRLIPTASDLFLPSQQTVEHSPGDGLETPGHHRLSESGHEPLVEGEVVD